MWALIVLLSMKMLLPTQKSFHSTFKLRFHLSAAPFISSKGVNHLLIHVSYLNCARYILCSKALMKFP